MAVISSRKVFLITIFVLFTSLYWALFFPLLWIHTKPRVSHVLWIVILIAAVVLFIVLALITAYLVKKYNWWMNAGNHQKSRHISYEYGFQYLHHLYKSQELHPQPQQKIVVHQDSHQVPQQRQDIELSVRNVNQTVATEVCEVIVDKRILQDAETQTDDDGSVSPGLYRTSLIMDVNRDSRVREPRSPSGDSTRSNTSMWYYPTLAEYYNSKTEKLRLRLDKAQQEHANIEHQERTVVLQQSTSLNDEVDYSIPDTRLFLKREQVYSNLEIR